MRLIHAFALILALTPGALFAGQRATFTAKGDPKTLTVTVADNGDVRIEGTGEKEYGLRIGDTFYLVSNTAKGLTVARASDLPLAVKKAVPSEMRQLFGKLGKDMPKSKLVITPKGERAINGRTGKLYEISGLDRESGKKPAEFVMSDDPALKPFGDNLTDYISAITAPAMVMFGPMMEGLLTDMKTVFALGTPLDADGKFILTTVETVDTKAADFTLPAEPMSVDALAASFGEKDKTVMSTPEDEVAPMDDAAEMTDEDTATMDEPVMDDTDDAAMDAAAAAMDAAAEPADMTEAAPEPKFF